MRLLTLAFYKEVFILLKDSAVSFMEHKGLRLSAALAYYTIFAMAPLLLIVIWVVGFLYGQHMEGPEAVQNEIFNEAAEILGKETTAQIQDIVRRISLSDQSGIGVVIGIGTLVFASTTIFVQIQEGINFIWDVKPKPKKGWKKMLINRVLSFSMVLGLGFLLVTSLLLNGIIMALSGVISRYFPELSVYLMSWVSTGITFLVITVLFGFIFRFLPDAKIRFRDILGGALFTAFLFMLGRYLIGLYMQYTAPGSAYGAAGSLIVLLLWVNYSAAIMYFGAEFTKQYAKKHGNGIIPASYAVRVIHIEQETRKAKPPEQTPATDIHDGEGSENPE